MSRKKPQPAGPVEKLCQYLAACDLNEGPEAVPRQPPEEETGEAGDEIRRLRERFQALIKQSGKLLLLPVLFLFWRSSWKVKLSGALLAPLLVFAAFPLIPQASAEDQEYQQRLARVERLHLCCRNGGDWHAKQELANTLIE